MQGERVEMLRAIKKLGQSSALFQFRQVREEMGVESGDKNAAARLHNTFKGLEEEKVIEEVPGARKRNRYYRLADEERLRALLGVPFAPRAPAPPAPTGSAPDRLSRIEAQIAAMAERLERVDRSLERLAAMWT